MSLNFSYKNKTVLPAFLKKVMHEGVREGMRKFLVTQIPIKIVNWARARCSVVSDLRSETKGSRFKSSC